MTANENQIVVYQPNEAIRLDVRLENEVQTKEPPLQSIFCQNKFWDAKSLLIKFIRRAKKELIVIDAYPGVATLDMLAKRGRGVKIELVTHSNGELEETDFEAFGAQCGKFTKTICGICHDRFIIADQKEIFWKMRRRNAHAFRREDSAKAEPEGRTSVRGASLKVLGRTCFRFRRGNGGQAAFAKLATGEIRHIKKSAFVMGVGTRA